ncbi:hypothetical protein [Pseudochrobactrum sp. MP213Fo]|uniref:hypothetical protein n=1 Tax=Pseudochrobactrum sp. MP213Fo TaxID=3022250 RepID=UPI003BA1C328
MKQDSLELRKIRDRHSSLGGAEWLLSSNGEVTIVEARTDGEPNEVARFHRNATPDEIDFFANAPHMVTFLLGLVDRAIAAARKAAPQAPDQAPGKTLNYAAEAAMKCEEAGFLAFLEQCHGLERPLTQDRAAQRLRSLFGVTSRKELNSNSAAAQRWRSLRGDYDVWRRDAQ